MKTDTAPNVRFFFSPFSKGFLLALTLSVFATLFSPSKETLAAAACLPGLPCITPATVNDPKKTNDGPNISTAPNVKKISTTGTCDADLMNQIYSRAYLESQRETIKAGVLIRKPDSVLEYSCFNQLATLTGEEAGLIFSQSEQWGSKLFATMAAIDAALDALANADFKELASVLNSISPDLLKSLPVDKLAEIIDKLDVKQFQEFISKLSPETAAALPPGSTENQLKKAKEEKTIGQLLKKIPKDVLKNLPGADFAAAFSDMTPTELKEALLDLDPSVIQNLPPGSLTDAFKKYSGADSLDILKELAPAEFASLASTDPAAIKEALIKNNTPASLQNALNTLGPDKVKELLPDSLDFIGDMDQPDYMTLVKGLAPDVAASLPPSVLDSGFSKMNKDELKTNLKDLGVQALNLPDGSLAATLSNYSPTEIKDLIDTADDNALPLLLKSLPSSSKPDIINSLDPATKSKLTPEMILNSADGSTTDYKTLLDGFDANTWDNMSPETALQMLGKLAPPELQALMEKLPPGTATNLYNKVSSAIPPQVKALISGATTNVQEFFSGLQGIDAAQLKNIIPSLDLDSALNVLESLIPSQLSGLGSAIGDMFNFNGLDVDVSKAVDYMKKFSKSLTSFLPKGAFDSFTSKLSLSKAEDFFKGIGDKIGDAFPDGMFDNFFNSLSDLDFADLSLKLPDNIFGNISMDVIKNKIKGLNVDKATEWFENLGDKLESKVPSEWADALDAMGPKLKDVMNNMSSSLKGMFPEDTFKNLFDKWDNSKIQDFVNNIPDFFSSIGDQAKNLFSSWDTDKLSNLIKGFSDKVLDSLPTDFFENFSPEKIKELFTKLGSSIISKLPIDTISNILGKFSPEAIADLILNFPVLGDMLKTLGDLVNIAGAVSAQLCLPVPVYITGDIGVGQINDTYIPCVGINVYMGDARLQTSIKNIVLTSLATYINNNFGHKFLGGKGNIDYDPGAKDYNCASMDLVYHQAKCTDIITDDRFWTFQNLISPDPRLLPLACVQGTKITQPPIDLAENKGFSYVAFDRVSFGSPSYSSLFSSGSCNDPIPTGLIVMKKTQSASSAGQVFLSQKEFTQDAICTNPACTFTGTKCE